MSEPRALSPDTPRGEALARLRRALAQAGIAEAAIDARLLLLDAARIDAAALLAAPEHPLGEEAAARLRAHATARLARTPVARILGSAEFWGLPFQLSEGTLVPRPDTETLVETALALCSAPQARVLDLGVGSGAVLVALLWERPAWWGIGLDRSEDAVRTARANAIANAVGARVGFFVGDWLAATARDARFDLVVSNPPYIPAADIAGLADEVRVHDPARALDGGADGLDAYRRILAQAPAHLAPQGVLALEVGIGQADDVARLGRTAGLAVVRIARDLAGIERVVALRRS